MANTPPESSNNSEQSADKRNSVSRIFWLTFLVVSLALAWHCFYAPSNDIAWATDFPSAQEQSMNSEKSMILFFTASWCSPCQIMKRTVWADEEVAAEVNARFVPVMLYADDDNTAELFTLYQVGGTPTTIITNPDGSVVDYAVGKIDKPAFLQLIEEK